MDIEPGVSAPCKALRFGTFRQTVGKPARTDNCAVSRKHNAIDVINRFLSFLVVFNLAFSFLSNHLDNVTNTIHTNLFSNAGIRSGCVVIERISQPDVRLGFS